MPTYNPTSQGNIYKALAIFLPAKILDAPKTIAAIKRTPPNPIKIPDTKTYKNPVATEPIREINNLLYRLISLT